MLKNNCLNHIPLSARDVDILLSPKAFCDKIFELIKQAKNRIYLSALYIENDTTGQRLFDALYEAKAANPDLDIVLLVDFHRAQRGRIGEAKTENNATFYCRRNELSQHNIEVYGLPVKVREFFGVMHLKGFVFDDDVLYSGASINDIYFHTRNRYRYDRYILIHNRELANSLTEIVCWMKTNSKVMTPLNRQPIPNTKSIKRQIRYFSSKLKRLQYNITPYIQDSSLHITPVLGFGRRGNRLNKAIIEMIRKAQNSIILYTPYFNLPSALKKALIKAMKRNVKVTLITGDKTASDFYIHNTAEFNVVGTLPYIYETLLRGFLIRYQSYIEKNLLSLRIWKHNDNSFHVKGISVDNTTYLLTGNNLNPRAWGLDLENALLIYDKNGLLQNDFKKEHNCLIENTYELCRKEQLDDPELYPGQVKKILGRLKRVYADKVLKRFI